VDVSRKIGIKNFKKYLEMKKKVNKLGVENSLYNNIRKKAEMNKEAGVKGKKPTKAMLEQEKKIKNKSTKK
jgi:hypothetical protein